MKREETDSSNFGNRQFVLPETRYVVSADREIDLVKEFDEIKKAINFLYDEVNLLMPFPDDDK